MTPRRVVFQTLYHPAVFGLRMENVRGTLLHQSVASWEIYWENHGWVYHRHTQMIDLETIDLQTFDVEVFDPLTLDVLVTDVLKFDLEVTDL